MILGLDVGASNVKASLIDYELKETGNTQVPAFASGDAYSALADVRNELLKSGSRSLDAIAVTCSPFLQTTTYDKGLFEIDKSIRRVFKRNLRKEAAILYLGRDARFRSLKEIARDLRYRYLNIVKYIDANWLPLVHLVGTTRRVSDFVCASFGTSSTSLIPVINGKVQVGLTENRLSSSKLVLMGKLYTPVVSFVDEIDFRGARIPWNPYDNQLTVGEVGFLSGSQCDAPWTATKRDVRFATTKRISYAVGWDMKVVTKREVRDICGQILAKFRSRLIERVGTVIEQVPCRARTIYVCGGDNRFLVDMLSKSFDCVDTGLGNTATAYGTAVLYCRTMDGSDCGLFQGASKKSAGFASHPISGLG